jgi:FkbM family methyltransferase
MERMSETIIQRYTTLLPSRWGWFCGLASDRYQTHSTMFQGEWGHEETEILRRFVNEGDIVVDAGANVGSITMPLALMVGHSGRVYSFEPQRFAFACLWANVALNSMVHIVHPIQAVLSDEHGEMKVPSLGLNDDTYNAGGLTLTKEHPEGDMVQVIKLDDLKLERLDLLKADVEGMEPNVLRGAAATIDLCRPVIWCEDLDYYPGTAQALEVVLAQHKYVGWRVDTPIWSPNNSRTGTVNLWPDQCDKNLLAIPAEDKCPAWIGRKPDFGA